MVVTITFPPLAHRSRVMAWLMRVLDLCPYAPVVTVSAPRQCEMTEIH